MTARQIFVRTFLASVLIIGAMGEMTLCGGEEAAAPDRKAEAQRPRRGGRGGAEWEKLLKELEGQGITREKLGELFKRKEKGEALDADEEAALQKVMELRRKLGQARGGRGRRPGEKVLDRWQGAWFSTAIIRPSAWVPEGREQTEVREVKWVLNGRFQEATTRSDSHEAREIQRVAGQGYNRWTFDTNGGHGYWTGTWDEEAKTMTWKLDFGAIKGTMVDSFSDPDPNYVTTLVIKDAEGEVLLDIEAEHTRLLAK